MGKFPEATKRLFGSVFVCRKCKSKMRADSSKVMKGLVSCRKCNSIALRPIKKK